MLAVLTPSAAHAGAWIAPEGGQLIWTELAGERDNAFYSESSLYWEEPLDTDVSLVAAPWVTNDPRANSLDGLRWELTLAGKAALHRGERTVTAVQGGVVWNSDPIDGCAEAQAELRWLAGRAIGERSFANVEAAERLGDEGCGGERIDLTLGRRFNQDWLGLAQIFAEEPRLGEGTVKAQISFVRFGVQETGVQIGLRARLDGEAMEPALLLGFWRQGRR